MQIKKCQGRSALGHHMIRHYDIILNSLSRQRQYCEGLWGGTSGCDYFLGVQLSVAKTKLRFSHHGSLTLDKIMSFDLAEVAQANFGQINMMSVSSFCGPRGLIWGYDVFAAGGSPRQLDLQSGSWAPVYDITVLEMALGKLLGTVEAPRFPFLPGSHVPCATKNITQKGECILYAAEGIGIPADRHKQACLLMEDAGQIPLNVRDLAGYKRMITEKLAQSVVAIGINQRVEFREIFVGIKDLYVGPDEVGCALVVSPYFCLAQDALPEVRDIFSLDIFQWERIVGHNFICRNGLD